MRVRGGHEHRVGRWRATAAMESDLQSARSAAVAARRRRVDIPERRETDIRRAEGRLVERVDAER
eukprot:3745040-Prymnesium_polylepis.1